MNRSHCLAFVLALLFALPCAAAGRPVRYLLHGGMSHEPPSEDYLRFVEQVRPDVLIAGVFDARLYALAVPPPGRKALPPGPLLERWKGVARRLHGKGIRLVGHMEINTVSDDPRDLARGTGWIGYFDRAWDEKRLGRRPARRAADLLEEPDLGPHARPDNKVPQGDTVARCGCRVNTRALVGCINKPAWREVQKRLVKAAVEAGIDGFITNRNYFGHCGCEHCRLGFRRWLAARHGAGELKKHFGIADLDKQPPGCVVGAHREIDRAPDALALEKQRFAKQRMKEFFDEVFLDHGRGLRKDLFAAQWNHLAFFDELHLDRGHLPVSTRTTFAHGAADERWGLPADVWGKGEDLIWYCNWGTTQNTILAKQYAGDTVLYGKYVRALSAGRPHVINKYDFYRPRNMMAEAAGLGYATNAIATPWQTEEDRAVVLRYFAFLKKHEALYTAAEPHAEVGLVFPRRALHAGDASPLEYVESAGRSLVRDHRLFDLLPDDLLPGLQLQRYRAVVVTGAEYLHGAERAALLRYAEKGGKLLVLPVAREDRDRPAARCRTADRLAREPRDLLAKAVLVPGARLDRAKFLKELTRLVGGADRLSGFEAPWTVQAHVYHQRAARRLVVHLVNYDHNEKAAGKSVAAREAPIAAPPVAVRLRLPEGFRPASARFLSPDAAKEQAVTFRRRDGWLECRTPGFLVYGVLVVDGRGS